MKHCSTCTCVEHLLNARELLEILTTATPRRDVYRASDGSGWFVTCGGGQASAEAVEELVNDGHIKPRYSTLPDDCFYVGDTIDMLRSVFTKRNRKIVYLNDLGEPK